MAARGAPGCKHYREIPFQSPTPWYPYKQCFSTVDDCGFSFSRCVHRVDSLPAKEARLADTVVVLMEHACDSPRIPDVTVDLSPATSCRLFTHR